MRTIVIVVHAASTAAGTRTSLVCDVGDLPSADEASLDVLARLQLTARRFGTTIRLRNASRVLVDLIEIAGLADVLLVEASGVEPDRQAEEREVVGVDEEVDPGDDAA